MLNRMIFREVGMGNPYAPHMKMFLGGIIGGAAGALGGIFGGISKNKMIKKMQAMVNEQKRENQDWYDRRYNEDFTQRADAQRMLTMTEDAIRQRNRAAAGTQAVTGGNEASVAAAKAANNAATADAASRIAAAGEQRRDQIENQYQNRKEALQGQLNQLEVQKAQNTAQAIQGVSQAAAGIASMDDIWSRGGYKKLTPGRGIVANPQGSIVDSVHQLAAKNGW